MASLGVPGCHCRKCGPVNKGDTIKLLAANKGKNEGYQNIWESNYSITTSEKNIIQTNTQTTNMCVIKVSSTVNVSRDQTIKHHSLGGVNKKEDIVVSDKGKPVRKFSACKDQPSSVNVPTISTTETTKMSINTTKKSVNTDVNKAGETCSVSAGRCIVDTINKGEFKMSTLCSDQQVIKSAVDKNVGNGTATKCDNLTTNLKEDHTHGSKQIKDKISTTLSSSQEKTTKKKCCCVKKKELNQIGNFKTEQVSSPSTITQNVNKGHSSLNVSQQVTTQTNSAGNANTGKAEVVVSNNNKSAITVVNKSSNTAKVPTITTSSVTTSVNVNTKPANVSKTASISTPKTAVSPNNQNSGKDVSKINSLGNTTQNINQIVNTTSPKPNSLHQGRTKDSDTIAKKEELKAAVSNTSKQVNQTPLNTKQDNIKVPLTSTPQVITNTGDITKKSTTTNVAVKTNIQKNDKENNLNTGRLKVEEGIKIIATSIETKKDVRSEVFIKNNTTSNVVTNKKLFSDDTQKNKQTENVKSSTLNIGKKENVVEDSANKKLSGDQVSSIKSSSTSSFKISTSTSTKNTLNITSISAPKTNISPTNQNPGKDVSKINSLVKTTQNINQIVNKTSPQPNSSQQGRTNDSDNIVKKEELKAAASNTNTLVNKAPLNTKQDNIKVPLTSTPQVITNTGDITKKFTTTTNVAVKTNIKKNSTENNLNTSHLKVEEGIKIIATSIETKKDVRAEVVITNATTSNVATKKKLFNDDTQKNKQIENVKSGTLNIGKKENVVEDSANKKLSSDEASSIKSSSTSSLKISTSTSTKNTLNITSISASKTAISPNNQNPGKDVSKMNSLGKTTQNINQIVNTTSPKPNSLQQGRTKDSDTIVKKEELKVAVSNTSKQVNQTPLSTKQDNIKVPLSSTSQVITNTGDITKKSATANVAVKTNIQKNDKENNLSTGHLKVEESIKIITTSIETKKDVRSEVIIKNTTTSNMATDKKLFSDNTQKNKQTENVKSSTLNIGKKENVVEDSANKKLSGDQASSIKSSSTSTLKISTSTSTKNTLNTASISAPRTDISPTNENSGKDVSKINSLVKTTQNINQIVNKTSPQPNSLQQGRTNGSDNIVKKVELKAAASNTSTLVNKTLLNTKQDNIKVPLTSTPQVITNTGDITKKSATTNIAVETNIQKNDNLNTGHLKVEESIKIITTSIETKKDVRSEVVITNTTTSNVATKKKLFNDDTQKSKQTVNVKSDTLNIGKKESVVEDSANTKLLSDQASSIKSSSTSSFNISTSTSTNNAVKIVEVKKDTVTIESKPATCQKDIQCNSAEIARNASTIDMIAENTSAQTIMENTNHNVNMIIQQKPEMVQNSDTTTDVSPRLEIDVPNNVIAKTTDSESIIQGASTTNTSQEDIKADDIIQQPSTNEVASTNSLNNNTGNINQNVQELSSDFCNKPDSVMFENKDDYNVRQLAFTSANIMTATIGITKHIQTESRSHTYGKDFESVSDQSLENNCQHNECSKTDKSASEIPISMSQDSGVASLLISSFESSTESAAFDDTETEIVHDELATESIQSNVKKEDSEMSKLSCERSMGINYTMSYDSGIKQLAHNVVYLMATVTGLLQGIVQNEPCSSTYKNNTNSASIATNSNGSIVKIKENSLQPNEQNSSKFEEIDNTGKEVIEVINSKVHNKPASISTSRDSAIASKLCEKQEAIGETKSIIISTEIKKEIVETEVTNIWKSTSVIHTIEDDKNYENINQNANTDHLQQQPSMSASFIDKEENVKKIIDPIKTKVNSDHEDIASNKCNICYVIIVILLCMCISYLIVLYLFNVL